MKTPILAVVVTLAPSVVAAQSIGDIAKQTDADRKAVTTPSRLYTNTDLNVASGARLSVMGEPGGAVPTAVLAIDIARADEARAVAKQDEPYWRARMRNLQTALDNDRTLLAAALKRQEELDRQVRGDELLFVGDRLVRGQIEANYQAAVTEAGRLQANVANDMRAIAVAEDEALHADAPPGWLRSP